MDQLVNIYLKFPRVIGTNRNSEIAAAVSMMHIFSGHLFKRFVAVVAVAAQADR